MRSAIFGLAAPGWLTPARSPLTSAMKTGTPMRLKRSAITWSVTVLPVPVAPATRPWRLAIFGRRNRSVSPLAIRSPSSAMVPSSSRVPALPAQAFAEQAGHGPLQGGPEGLDGRDLLAGPMVLDEQRRADVHLDGRRHAPHDVGAEDRERRHRHREAAVLVKIVGHDGDAAAEFPDIGIGVPGKDAAPALEGDDGPPVPQVVLTPQDRFVLAPVEVDRDRPDPGDVAGDEVDHERVERVEKDVDEIAELAHVAMEMAQHELGGAFAAEDHLIGREEDHPGHGPDQDGDVLVGAAVVADDDVRALADEILGASEIDLLGQQEKPGRPVDGRPDGFEFLFVGAHVAQAILPKRSPDFKTPDGPRDPLAPPGRPC